MNTTTLLYKKFFATKTIEASRIKHVFLLGFLFLILSISGFSQNVGISATGAPTDNSAGLDINFTNRGLLIPRVSLTSTNDVATITTPATSLLVYNINASMSGGGIGYWYWDGSTWVKLLSGALDATAWSTLGNGGSIYGTNFLGTTDNVGLSLRTNNIEALHIDSLQNVSIGVENTPNKFEVAGSFRMHQDSFNMLHTSDLFGAGGAIPGVKFAGTNFRVAGDDALYLNGIVDLPVGVSDQPVLSIFGNIGTSNPGLQSLITASPGGINMGSQGNNGGSNINMDNAAHINMGIGSGDTGSNISLSTNSVNFYHGINNIGYSNANFYDSSFTLNVNENVNNYRSTGINIQPDNYNVYNNDNDPANTANSGYNFRSNGYSYNINNNTRNVNANQSLDTGRFSMGIGDNNLNINTLLEQRPGELKSYISDNAANTQSGFQITKDNSNFWNNDNSLNNNANYNLTNNSFSVNVNNATDNRTTALYIDQNNFNFNQNNNAVGSSSNLNLSDNGIYFNSNNSITNESFLMNGATASFTGNAAFMLGLGTNTPTNTLHIAGSTDPVRFEGLQSGSSSDDLVTVDGSGVLHTSAASSLMGWGTSGNAGTNSGNFIGTTDAQDFVIRTNNVDRLTVSSSGTTSTTGDVGIGTSVPVSKLDVNAGTISISGIGQGPDQALDFRDLSNGGQGEINWSKAAGHALSASIRSVGNASFSNKGLGFFTNNANDGTTDADERMRITPSGHVGIGTTTPKSLLETAGSFGTAITTTTTSLTLDDSYHTIIVTGGTPVITLPAPGASNNRRTYRIINQNFAVVVVVSSYIDFTGLPAVSIPGQTKIEVQSDGTNWYRVD